MWLSVNRAGANDCISKTSYFLPYLPELRVRFVWFDEQPEAKRKLPAFLRNKEAIRQQFEPVGALKVIIQGLEVHYDMREK